MSVNERNGMPTNLQSRSQYLVLAEFSRKAVRALSEYAGNASSSEFPSGILQPTVDALQAIQKGDTYQFGQRPASALGSYEQLRTLQQVFHKPEEVNEAIALTSKLLTHEGPRDVAEVRRVIELFTKLQAKALWNFEQPTPAPAPDLDELCRSLKTA